MEGAPLRPVPLRPTGPVDAAAALAHVTTMLPVLDEEARRALALVELGGLDRMTAAAKLGLEEPAAAAALARGRKALRRSMFPLAGSGWCERAERLLSDRMDGEIPPGGVARLDAHLSNCERCQEHDLRLAQALDTLGRTFVVAAPPAAMLEAATPELRVVETAAMKEPPQAVAEETAPERRKVLPPLLVIAVFVAAATIIAVVVLVAAGVL